MAPRAESPCRWSMAVSNLSSVSDNDLADLCEADQISRGKELLNMLKTATEVPELKRSSSSCLSMKRKLRSKASAPHGTVIVKRTFIEVVPGLRTRLRSRNFTDSQIECGIDQEDRLWQKVSPDVLSELSDAGGDEFSDSSGLTDGSVSELSTEAEQFSADQTVANVSSSESQDEVGATPFPDSGGNQMQFQSDMYWFAVNQGDNPYSGKQPVTWWPSSSYSTMPQASAAATFMELVRAPVAQAPHHFTSQGCSRSSRAQPEVRTTVMIRNVPNELSRTMLRNVVDAEGFARQYDLIYLPVDFATRSGLGYAFVNFLKSDMALRFFEHFEGFTAWPVSSDKVGSVAWSDASQGLQAHVERYRNSPVMHWTIQDEWKPSIFDAEGNRIPFPCPTKSISAPKVRQPRVKRANLTGSD